MTARDAPPKNANKSTCLVVNGVRGRGARGAGDAAPSALALAIAATLAPLSCDVEGMAVGVTAASDPVLERLEFSGTALRPRSATESTAGPSSSPMVENQLWASRENMAVGRSSSNGSLSSSVFFGSLAISAVYDRDLGEERELVVRRRRDRDLSFFSTADRSATTCQSCIVSRVLVSAARYS